MHHYRYEPEPHAYNTMKLDSGRQLRVWQTMESPETSEDSTNLNIVREKKESFVAMDESQYYLTPSIEATYVNVPKQNLDSRRSSWTYGQESVDGEQLDDKVTLTRVSATTHLNHTHFTRQTLHQSDRRKLLSIAKRLDVGHEQKRENLQATKRHLISALTLVEKNLLTLQNTNAHGASHASTGWRKYICCLSK